MELVKKLVHQFRAQEATLINHKPMFVEEMVLQKALVTLRDVRSTGGGLNCSSACFVFGGSKLTGPESQAIVHLVAEGKPPTSIGELSDEFGIN